MSPDLRGLALCGLLTSLPLSAQDGAAWARQGEGASYQFQLRAHRALGDLRATTQDATGGGGGFLMILGTTPLRLRLRMDGDDLPARPPASNLRTAGLGLEALYLLPFAPDWEPYVALGPALQHWEYRPVEAPGAPRRTFNKLATRLELGFWAHRHVGLSAGYLQGPLDAGRTARMIYLGFNFR